MVRFIADDKNADRNAPEMDLEVIVAGLPRAATSSLQAALDRLGYNCMHMANVMPHAWRERQLIDIMDEKDTARRHEKLRKFTAGFNAIADLPATIFALDFMDMYPNAKVVLNGRPSAKGWLASAKQSFSLFFRPYFWLLTLLHTNDRLYSQICDRTVVWVREHTTAEHPLTEQLYLDLYPWYREEARNRGVDLIDYMPEEGWGPLCKFLSQGGEEVPVPDEPFPRLNEKEAFAETKRVLVTRDLTRWGILLAVAGLTWGFGRSRGLEVLGFR